MTVVSRMEDDDGWRWIDTSIRRCYDAAWFCAQTAITSLVDTFEFLDGFMQHF